jgi:hypothetical protein
MRVASRSPFIGKGHRVIGRATALPPALSPQDLAALHAYFDRAKRRGGASRWARLVEMFAGRSETVATKPASQTD